MGIFGKSKKERKKEQLTELIKEGLEFFKIGNYNQAINIFEKAEKIGSDMDICHESLYASKYLRISQKHMKLKDIDKILLLSKDEKIIWKGSNCRTMDDTDMTTDFLVITSKNLYFMGWNWVELVLPLENIISISDLGQIYKESIFYEDNKISVNLSLIRGKFKNFKITFDTYGLNNDCEDARAILLDLVQKKKNESKKRVNINIDFSSIKECLKNGGVVMQTFKCPGCGASLEFPENTDITTCQFCGNKIKAVDLFERIKSII